MQLKGHNNKVRCIDWYEDDTGFSSCGMDGNAFHFDLAFWKTDQKRSEELGINAKGVVFTGLCNIPGRRPVTSERHQLRYPGDHITGGVPSQRRKAFFAGVGKENRPARCRSGRAASRR
jgi:hypothetical protein